MICLKGGDVDVTEESRVPLGSQENGVKGDDRNPSVQAPARSGE